MLFRFDHDIVEETICEVYMDGFGKTLYWFQEENMVIEVPFFQRPYVWDEDNWRSLVSSIENARAFTLPFIGSFIMQKKKGQKNYWVIDGQQRITTLTVFIKCFLDFNKTLHPNTRTYLDGMINITKMVDSETYISTPRLIPSNADRESYEKVMNKELDVSSLKAGESRIVDCYLFFKNYFENLDKTNIKDLTDKLVTTSKYVIAITLDENDDEQEIFDTVNSLGKRLTNSDIVKNYLYQKMKSFAGDNEILIEKVLNHYKKYWEKIFIDGERRDFWDERISLGRITTTNLDAFLKDYGTIKGIYIPSDGGGFDGLAKQYKNYINKLTQEDLMAFSIELSGYAETFYKMKTEYENCDDFRISDALNVTLLILDKLETSTFNPYILKIVKDNKKDRDSNLKALQKFIIQRFIWKASVKNYNKVCLSLLTNENPQNYLTSYNEKTFDVAWDQFPPGLKSIKNTPANLLLFVIEMIRRNQNGEDNYADALVFNKTLEHIMPQKWERNWKDVPSYCLNERDEYILLDNAEDIQKNRKNKVYSLGNMTLLTSKLNASISNDSFENKIEGGKHKGIKSFVGTLSVAQEIVDIYNKSHSWDERNIIERENYLFDELNEYFNFVDGIVKNTDPVRRDVSLEKAYFDELFFQKKKIGTMIKESFSYFSQSNILDDADLAHLLDKEYCRKNLGCAYAVLVCKKNETIDEKGRCRYYKDKILLNGHDYYLCREWFEDDRKHAAPWLKNKIFKE